MISFWVDSDELGFRIREMRERRKRREEEREMIQENEGNRVPNPFILAPESGRVRTDPYLVSYPPLDLGLC